MLRIVMHRTEFTNVFADHFAAARAAFPSADVDLWDKAPKDMLGHTIIKVGNSYFLGTDRFAAYAKALGRARKVYVAHNDYTSPLPTQLRNAVRGRDVVLLSTVPGLKTIVNFDARMWDWFSDLVHVDWNRASYGIDSKPVLPSRDHLVYWGALRKGRTDSFTRYFNHPPYRVALSSAHRSREAWAKLCPSAEWLGRVTLDEAAQFKATIYISDDKHADCYMSVACRFYEAVARGLLIFIDDRSERTFTRANIDVGPFLVDGPSSLRTKMGNANHYRSLQQKFLRRNYFLDTVKQLRKAVL